jgi:hypothetical protein
MARANFGFRLSDDHECGACNMDGISPVPMRKIEHNIRLVHSNKSGDSAEHGQPTFDPLFPRSAIELKEVAQLELIGQSHGRFPIPPLFRRSGQLGKRQAWSPIAIETSKSRCHFLW